MITALFFFAAVNAYDLQQGVTPVQKVIGLLNNMHAKGTAMLQEEQVRVAKFKEWCGTIFMQKTDALKESNSLIGELNAAIMTSDTDVDELAGDIEGLDSDIARWKQDMKAAGEVRKKEKDDYTATHADYSESLDAIVRATNTLQSQHYDRAQALLQKVSSLDRVPPSARAALTAFLDAEQPSKGPDPMNIAAPEANAYEFQSGGVIDMLKKLEAKFDDERNELWKDEKNAQHAYEMMMQSLTDSIEAAESERARKAKEHTRRKEDGAEARGNLADTTATRDADQTYLNDLQLECVKKSSDFSERQHLRMQELAQIKRAVQILSTQQVSGAAEKHLPSLLQKTSMMQRFMHTDTGVLQGKVAKFLKDRATKLHSKTLTLLATKVADDPFAKVKKMIKDLVQRLMEEANQETEHKGWCDTELATNAVQRKSKQDSIEALMARHDKLSSEIAKLGQEIADLSAAINAIDKAVTEATASRKAEKAKNLEAIKDAKAAQDAVSQVLVVLKDFYAKAAESTALMQQPSEDAPETFTTAYKGMQSESEGVFGMLEVILSDFSRLETETTTAEETAAADFTKFSNDSEVDRATKTTDMNGKDNLKTRKTKDLQETKNDLSGTQQELDSVLAYYEKLKPSCVDAGVNYDDRVERREAEIQSLKEALQILAGEDI